MDKMKKWFTARRMGSMDNLYTIQPLPETPLLPHRTASKTEFELTSLKVKQFLEKQRYHKVVETLRELPHDFILKCLESFPFKDLNSAVPESFAIWETLLTKLHNSEDGFIPYFPYAACDELVLQIARLLQACEESLEKDAYLVQGCKRVLKKVYMQYNEVLERLYKENDRVEHALYTLCLHLPLGTDCSAIFLHQAITEEVQACLVDYSDALERLEELQENEVLSLSEALLENPSKKVVDYTRVIEFPLAPNPSLIQLHERLYFNQCVLATLQPTRRQDNLTQLLEIMNERVKGDKEVLAIFAGIRKRNKSISDSEPVEPWLRKHQRAVECAISMLKAIEKELEITIPKVNSPVEENGPLIVPIQSRSCSDEDKSPSVLRRHSAAILDEYLWEEGEKEETDENRKLSLPISSSSQQRRPRSTSPHKFLRTNGPVSGSTRSVDSSEGSSTNLANGGSASIHDLHSTNSKESQPAFAFIRAHSMKAQSRAVVAGKKKSAFAFLPSSLTNLSTSNGSENKKLKTKSLIRSGSGSLVPWERHNSDGMSANQFMLQQELEYKAKELLQAREMIQELRKRDRELTDRLSEQAQRQLQDSEKFEDILLGASRPTMVVQRYQELYSQGRLEALDAIEGVPGVDGLERTLAVQLVLDVLKLSYSVASSSLEQLNRDWKRTLGVEEVGDKMAVRQLDSSVGIYLRRVCASHDVSSIIQEVETKLAERYSEIPLYVEIKQLESFVSYIAECAQVAWELCVQTPPMVINYSETEFNFDLHTRFYNANKNSDEIIVYYWPTLLQSSSGPILFRGVVLT